MRCDTWQVYDPKADVLQNAKRTGHALASAAAAQRAKRAAARPPPNRRPPALSQVLTPHARDMLMPHVCHS